MKKRTQRVFGGLAIAAGSLGALAALLIRNNSQRRDRLRARDESKDVWARPGMSVTFRAELMPGRDRSARTFRVRELLPSGRVLLLDAHGEHAQREFEALR